MRTRFAVVALIAAAMTGGAAGAAQGAVAEDPTFTFDAPNQTVEYGESWYFAATANNAPGPSFWEAIEGSLTGGPSGYTAQFSWYKVDELTVAASLYPPSGVRPLVPGSYAASLVLGEQEGFGPGRVTATGTLVVTPAPLGIELRIGADPSNPANAIVSARFTGAFVDTYFTSEDPMSGLSPAGRWDIKVEDASGNAVHEFSLTREEGDDVLAVSSYWSDVPAGDYTARASFTVTGDSADNFEITQPAPVAFASAPAPGSTSTATPAPPTAPESDDAGLTLPAWIPLVAGVITAGLIALTVVQIVRLRRAGRILPAPKEVGA